MNCAVGLQTSVWKFMCLLCLHVIGQRKSHGLTQGGRELWSQHVAGSGENQTHLLKITGGNHSLPFWSTYIWFTLPPAFKIHSSWGRYAISLIHSIRFKVQALWKMCGGLFVGSDTPLCLHLVWLWHFLPQLLYTKQKLISCQYTIHWGSGVGQMH